MKTYEQWIQEPEQLPWSVLGKWGRRFFGAFGAFGDLVRQDLYEASVSRYAARAPADALPFAAQDTDVPTFPAFDTQGALRERVGNPWLWHERQGTGPGFDDLFAILKLDPNETAAQDSSNGPHWFTSQWWASFAVVSRNPTGWGVRTDTWAGIEAAGITWGAWKAADASWGYTAPASVFSQLRQFVWDRKWVHGIPAHIVVSFGDGHIWGSLQVSGTTWTSLETAGTTWGQLAAVDRVLVIQTARFWNAMNREDGNKPLTWKQLKDSGARWGRSMTRS